MNHPSFFALDAYVLSPGSGEVEAHLKSCAQCQAHVASLKVQTPMPPKVGALEAPPKRSTPWWPLVFAAAAVLIGVVYFGAREQPGLITAKGTPAAALWLKREGKAVVWNGQPVSPGDSLRFEVAPAGFTHVTVYDEHTRQVLYEARVPEGGPALTPAWQFDGEAQSESLRVVLSLVPLSVETLQAASCTRSAEAYCLQFTLTRAGP